MEKTQAPLDFFKKEISTAPLGRRAGNAIIHPSREGRMDMGLDTKKIGAYIQACRKEAGLTQAELGEKLGVTPQSVSNWERGVSQS